MTLSIDLQAEIAKELLARAEAQSVSPSEYIQGLVLRDTTPTGVHSRPSGQQLSGQELIDIGASVRGLLSDDEVDTLFARNPLAGRPVDFA